MLRIVDMPKLLDKKNLKGENISQRLSLSLSCEKKKEISKARFIYS